jgi:hypothetical protein
MPKTFNAKAQRRKEPDGLETLAGKPRRSPFGGAAHQDTKVRISRCQRAALRLCALALNFELDRSGSGQLIQTLPAPDGRD